MAKLYYNLKKLGEKNENYKKIIESITFDHYTTVVIDGKKM